MKSITSGAVLLAGWVSTTKAYFNPLHHLGGNSPYFNGPNVHSLDPNPPKGCIVDQAAFLSRHGSRYPDPGAYSQWTALYSKIQAANFSTNSSELSFLRGWQPVLDRPAQELSQVSLGGYKELYDMGVDFRWDYPDLYKYGDPFVMWANMYQAHQPRVVDSARLFARGFLGPNATNLGSVYVVNNTDPRSIANSLSPSDLCPTYSDNGGGAYATQWANLYLPPIVKRINAMLTGLQFNSSDVVLFPYLCGFETQITGRRSPWCGVFSQNETLNYEYAQDIRYYYGGGLGANVSTGMMLPFLTALLDRFVDGPNMTLSLTSSTNGPTNTTTPTRLSNPFIAAFSNDGPINQLISASGIFDDQMPLPATYVPFNRSFKATNFVTMRGTTLFERLNCGTRGLFVRIKLNGAIYPVPACRDGPGRSCSLSEYRALIADKSAKFGDFETVCGGIANKSVVPVGQNRTTFLKDLTLPFEYVVRP